MSLYNPDFRVRLNRIPTAAEKLGAAIESLKGGTTLNPEVARQNRDVILKDIMDTADANVADLDNNRRYKFLDDYLMAQLSPRMVRNVYSGYSGDRYVMTPEDKLKMMEDYVDVLGHDSRTLRDVFGPLQAP